ncbi:MAG TPA: restriction endonuclease [Longimicrobium sp.]|nr:restriction endonuclease [Longimicrobium sp.]
MVRSTDYVARIRRLGWDGLRELWAQIAAGRTPGWPPGIALEYLVLRAFELDGAEVRWPFTVEISDETVEQIDGAVYAGTLACLVEVKDSASPVDIGVLAKMRNQLMRRPAGTVGLVASRSGFTAAAMRLAGYFAPQTVLLMRGTDLDLALRSESIVGELTRKYRMYVEKGMPQPFDDRSTAQ